MQVQQPGVWASLIGVSILNPDFLGKIDAEQKKNKMMANTGPGNYEIHLKDKKKEPAFTMGARLTTVDKRVAPGAGTYEIPSKMVEKQGRSMG